jgi:secreted trypsin-like serine protease
MSIKIMLHLSDNIHDLAISSPMFGENVRYANQGEFPFVVSIKRISFNNSEPENYHICTGTLVSNKDVLTAEHCSDNLLISDIEVIVGSNDIREGKQYNVSWWITYNTWISMKKKKSQYHNNDIMMLRVRCIYINIKLLKLCF